MDWGAIVVTALTSGVLVSLINALANRGKVAAESKKIQADCVATLAGYYSEELEAMRAEIKSLQGGRKSDEATIEDLKKAVKQRDRRIAELEKQVGYLKSERDAEVLELRKQVAELTARLDAMNGCEDAD